MDFKAVIPILGFESCSEVTLEQVDDNIYRLYDKSGKSTPSFTLIRPSLLRDDYIFDLPDSAVERLEVERAEQVEVLNIMIIDTPLENSRVNFLAPLLFNREKRLMGQIVLDNRKYPDFEIAAPLKNFMDKEEDAS
ncbi:flagellar assembly factor FliW [Hydrogenimonas sp.]|nr:flagellar assembly factor FliW [Hydrogenimonas sp.]